MPLVLPVQGDRRCGVHEGAGAWWDTMFLQGRLQHLRAWRVCGKGEFKLHFYELCGLVSCRLLDFLSFAQIHLITELREVNQQQVHCDWIHSMYSLLWRKKVASLWCLNPVLLICSEMLFKEESVFLCEGIFHSATWQIISKQFLLFINEYPEVDEISCVTFWCFRSSMDIKLFWLTVKTWHLLAKNKNLTRSRKMFPRCV